MTTPSSSSLEFVAELLAPENFAMVTKGVYRSAFPRSKNLTFLKSLGLKTVIPLVGIASNSYQIICILAY